MSSLLIRVPGRARCRVTGLTALLCLMMLPQCSTADDATDDLPAPTLEDVRFAMQASEQALAEFRVRIHADKQVRNDHADELTALWANSVFAQDRMGRLRHEDTGTSLPSASQPTDPPERRRIGVFNGEVGRSMYGSDRYRYGKVGDRSAVEVGTDPRDFLFSFSGRPLSDRFASVDRYEPPRWTEWRGHQVLEVVSRPREEANGDQYRSRYLFDAEKGLFPVYRGGEIRFPEVDDRWREYTATTIESFDQAGTGVWLPLTARTRSVFAFEEPLRKGEEFPVSSEYAVTFSDWEVSPAFSEEYFELEFEPGVTVTDEITGQVYKVAGVTDQTVTDTAAQARELQAEIPQRSRYHTILLLNLILTLSIAVLWIWYRRKQVDDAPSARHE